MAGKRSNKVAGARQAKSNTPVTSKVSRPAQAPSAAPPVVTVELSTNSIETQVAMLKRMSARESQVFLEQISQSQGNHHVQRLVEYLTNGKNRQVQRKPGEPCVGCPEEQAKIQRSSSEADRDTDGQNGRLQRKTEEPCVGCPEEGQKIQRTADEKRPDDTLQTSRPVQRKAEEPCVGCPEEGQIQRTTIGASQDRLMHTQAPGGSAGSTQESIEPDVPQTSQPSQSPAATRSQASQNILGEPDSPGASGPDILQGPQDTLLGPAPGDQRPSGGKPEPSIEEDKESATGKSVLDEKFDLATGKDAKTTGNENGQLKDKLEGAASDGKDAKQKSQSDSIIEKLEEKKKESAGQKKQEQEFGDIGDLSHAGKAGKAGQPGGKLREEMHELPQGSQAPKDTLLGPDKKANKGVDTIEPVPPSQKSAIKDKLEGAGPGGPKEEEITKESQKAVDQTAQELGKADDQARQQALAADEQSKTATKDSTDQAKQAAKETADKAAGDQLLGEKPAAKGEKQTVKNALDQLKLAGPKKGGLKPALKIKAKTAKAVPPKPKGKEEVPGKEPAAEPSGKLREKLQGPAPGTIGEAGQIAQVPDVPLDELKGGSLREAITNNLNKFLEQPPSIEPAPKNEQLVQQAEPGLIQRVSADPREWAKSILNSLRSDASSKKQNIQSTKGTKQSQLNNLSSSKAGQLRSQSAPLSANFNSVSQSAIGTATAASSSSNQQVQGQAAAQAGQASSAASQKENQVSQQVTQATEALNQESQALESKGDSKLRTATQEATSAGESATQKSSIKGEQEQNNWKGQEEKSTQKMGDITKEADGLFKLLQIKASSEGKSSKGEIETIWENFTGKKAQDVKEIESEGDKKIVEGSKKDEGMAPDSPQMAKWLLGTPEAEITAELEADAETLRSRAEATGNTLRGAAEGTANDFANVKNSLQTGVSSSINTAKQGLKSTTNTAKKAVKQAGKTALDNAKKTGKTVLDSVANTGKTATQAVQNVVNAAKNSISGKGGSIMSFFGSMVRSIVGGVKSVGSSAYQGVKNTFRSVKNTVRNTAKSIFSGIKQVVNSGKSSLGNLLESIKSGARAVWDSAKTLVSNTVTRIGDAVRSIGQLISSAIQTGITFVRQKIAQIRDKIMAGIDWVKQKVKAIWETIKEKAAALWAELKSRWESFKNKLKEAWEKIKGLAKTIIYKVCDAVPQAKGKPNEKARVDERRKVGDKDWTFNPEDVVKENYKGMGTPQLGNAMKDLAPFIGRGVSRDKLTGAEKARLDAALQKLAKARGMDPAEAQKQFDKAVKVRSEALDIAKKTGKDTGYELPPENMLYSEFWGSKEQMAFGNIVGDNLGLDPAFGSMLSPTGGLVGPGAKALHLKNSAIGYHGIAHDAAGYLSNYHKIGPGYEYRDQPSWDPTAGLETSDPLAGQVSGIHWWSQYMKGTKDEKKLGFMNPELTNINVGGVNVGIRLEVGLDKEVVSPEDMGPLEYLNLDMFARLRCSASPAGAR